MLAETLSLSGGERFPPLDLSPQRKKERTLAALLREKVTFALLELGLDCEKIAVDLSKGEQHHSACRGSGAADPRQGARHSLDEGIVSRGEKALPTPIRVVEGQLANNRWMLGANFSLVDCAYTPILNVIEKAGFSFADFPRITAYLDAARARPAWKDNPNLPDL